VFHQKLSFRAVCFGGDNLRFCVAKATPVPFGGGFAVRDG